MGVVRLALRRMDELESDNRALTDLVRQLLQQ